MAQTAESGQHGQSDRRERIIRALEALGVAGRVRIVCDGPGRAIVYVSGRRFGVFDFARNTFVD